MSDENVSGTKYKDNLVTVETAQSLEDLTHVLAIRAICFVHEHGTSTQNTCDGNDFQASHVLMRCDGEPIGSVRIRWFQGFVQFERFCIRPEFRNLRATKRMLNFAFEHVARKGFSKVITYAAPEYARLWQRLFKFRRTEGRPEVHLKGHEHAYVELETDLTVPANAIGLSAEPAVFQRIEGRWDMPSAYEVEQS